MTPTFMDRYSLMNRIAVLCAFFTFSFAAPACPKLTSASYEEENAARIIEDIFRETRLNDDEAYWGAQYQQEIQQYTKLFGMNYYLIFADLKINKAMARCAVNAKYEHDYERWLREMDRFDMAADQLGLKDRARYYFAKGLAVVQTIPDKIHTLPDAFYKAAEHGYPSKFLAGYIAKGTGGATGDLRGTHSGDVLLKLAESYLKGEVYQEAYKFYLLAAKSDLLNTGIFMEMLGCASRGGSNKLALTTSLLFIEIFSAYDAGKTPREGIMERVNLDAAMPAEQAWGFCENQCFTAAISYEPFPVPPPKEIKIKNVERFEGRYVERLLNGSGPYADLVAIQLCRKYWNDSAVVKKFIVHVKGGVDSTGSPVAVFAAKVREDARFAGDKAMAVWEARRWKRANRLDDFAREFPGRYDLAGMGSGEE